ncbi:hypothetical protein CLV56_0073 [Mumia flava]|uniref:Transcriptional regulator, AbiEi antitoxin, Type IV TA system n=1 Tax=Mumia flava TaxID=1348852 RepID=A0A2M9BD82_9ACTN|nr:hypothetical protein [Mumia flava]PJJ55874.1 hypothetical protein CLV56_0073 [Mumia flava]
MDSYLNEGRPFVSSVPNDLGLTRHAFRKALDEGQFRQIFKSVYVDARVPDTRGLRLVAAHLVTPPHAVVSDCFASWLFGVDTFKPSERHLLTPSLLVPHGSSRVRAPGVRCRQARLAPEEVVEVDGLLVTSPLRTTGDLARRLWRPYALAAVDGMVRAELVGLAELDEYVRSLRGFPGAPKARELVAYADPGAESPGESWTRLRMIDAGLPRPCTQIPVVDEYGNDRYFDLGYRQHLVAAEYDGREFHTTESDRDHDAVRREYFARRYGWRFVVGTRETVFGKDDAFEREIGELLGIATMPRQW